MKQAICRIDIYGTKNEKRKILEYLECRELVHITEAVSDAVFSHGEGGAELTELRKARADAERALAILERYTPDKGGLFSSLEGRVPLNAMEYEKYESRLPQTSAAVKRLLEADSEIVERLGEIERCRGEIAELEPWRSLDCDLRDGGTTHTAWFTCVMRGRATAEELTKRYTDTDDGGTDIYIEVIGSDERETRIFVVCLRDEEEKCVENLHKIGIYRRKSAIGGMASAEIEKRLSAIADMTSEIEERERECREYAAERDGIRFLIDYIGKEMEKCGAFDKISESRAAAVISGYVPEYAAEELKTVLENRFCVYAELSAAGEGPVLLKNPKAAEPVEGIVKTFALPNRHEIDPTTVMAIFYYVFFGLMLSDFAYGLIIFIGCAVAITKFKNMEQSLKKTLKMFMYCGLSTMVWGVLFGSYFGDAPEIIAEMFFKKTIDIKPLWFEPVTDPMRMLMFSFLLGIIHLFMALGIKAYQLVLSRRYAELVYDCVFWYMLIGGGIVYLFSVPMFREIADVDFILPNWATMIAAVTAVSGAVGILLFSARDGNFIKRLMKGAYSLYGVTGWLSDILSYSRLLALGLATGVIATVFNKMGSMLGGGVLGTVIFVIVFLVGHTLNIGVNLLGAYVHTNRLQFVEFFGKFYEGGGEEFVPFSANTKYFKFKKE